MDCDSLGARRIGDDELWTGEEDRMLHFLAFPPAVEQCSDAPGLQGRHVGDDPGRAVAHRNCDTVALSDASTNETMRELVGNSIEVGEVQPLVTCNDSFVRCI